MAQILIAEAPSLVVDFLVARHRGLEIQYDPMGFGQTSEGGYWIWETGAPKSRMEKIGRHFSPSTKPEQGWPIIDTTGLSVIRADNDYELDGNGFVTDIPIPVWAATHGQHSVVTDAYGPESGSHAPLFQIYDDDVTYGPTSLMAAMRHHLRRNLGPTAEIPDNLLTTASEKEPT